MGMLVAAVLLFIVSLIIFITTTKNGSNFFLTLGIFIAAIGSFGSFMEFNILPYLRTQTHLDASIVAFYEYLCSFLLSMGHFVPYSVFLGFTVYFSGYMHDKKLLKHVIYNIIIFAPAIACFILFPVERHFHPSFKVLSLWSGLYLVISTVMQIKSYRDSLTMKERSDKLFVSIAITPGVYVHYFMVLVTQAFGNKTIWHYGYVIVAATFTIYLVFIIRFGVFGLRVKFEKIKMDTAIKTINSSTLIFNHAVKNEVAKISMCSDLLRKFQEKIDSHEIKEKIGISTEIIDGSVNHLLNLMERINENSQPTVIKEEVFSLKELIDSTLKPFANISGNKINFNTIIDYDFQIYADYAHLKECLSNVIKNALDALKGQGNISIRISHSNRSIALIIEDNGPGIAKEHLSRIFDPFYSTKKSSQNFGLGLFYCLNTMKKHNGNIEISSTEGSGTIVRLIIPKKRVLSRYRLIDALEVSV